MSDILAIAALIQLFVPQYAQVLEAFKLPRLPKKSERGQIRDTKGNPVANQVGRSKVLGAYFDPESLSEKEIAKGLTVGFNATPFAACFGGLLGIPKGNEIALDRFYAFMIALGLTEHSPSLRATIDGNATKHTRRGGFESAVRAYKSDFRALEHIPESLIEYVSQAWIKFNEACDKEDDARTAEQTAEVLARVRKSSES